MSSSGFCSYFCPASARERHNYKVCACLFDRPATRPPWKRVTKAGHGEDLYAAGVASERHSAMRAMPQYAGDGLRGCISCVISYYPMLLKYIYFKVIFECKVPTSFFGDVFFFASDNRGFLCRLCCIAYLCGSSPAPRFNRLSTYGP